MLLNVSAPFLWQRGSMATIPSSQSMGMPIPALSPAAGQVFASAKITPISAPSLARLAIIAGGLQ
jgi:hypothetical protein